MVPDEPAADRLDDVVLVGGGLTQAPADDFEKLAFGHGLEGLPLDGPHFVQLPRGFRIVGEKRSRRGDVDHRRCLWIFRYVGFLPVAARPEFRHGLLVFPASFFLFFHGLLQPNVSACGGQVFQGDFAPGRRLELVVQMTAEPLLIGV